MSRDPLWLDFLLTVVYVVVRIEGIAGGNADVLEIEATELAVALATFKPTILLPAPEE